MKEYIRIIKFTLFSLSAGIIQIISFSILNLLLGSGNYWLCYLVSLILSILWNFTFNRKYTFKSGYNLKKCMLLTFIYYLIFTPVSTILGNYIVSKKINEYIVEICSMLTNLVTEFIYQRYIVYKNNVDSIK